MGQNVYKMTKKVVKNPLFYLLSVKIGIIGVDFNER